MKWEEVKLSDISVNIQTGPFGSQLHQSDYSENGIPVVMPKDLLCGKISEATIARVDESYINKLKRHIILNGDILYSRRGDVGRCAYATEKESGWLCGTGCLRVTIDNKQADSQYIFYKLQQAETIGWIEKHAIGATMLNLNTSILSNVPLTIPPIETQRRIADILSAYDNLIENNRKQIKLLEEAAQRLYKEWFVDLRFPGYENTAIVDGVPEGWSKTIFSEAVDILGGGTPKTTNSNYYGGLIPLYTPKDADNSFFAYSTITNITEEGLNNCNSKLYPKDTVIITARGTVGKITMLAVPMAMNQSCYAIRGKNKLSQIFIFFALNEAVSTLKSMANGGVFDTIISKTFENINIMIPSHDILQIFEKRMIHLLEQIKVKMQLVILLQQARDCLLPKLMSGELEV